MAVFDSCISPVFAPPSAPVLAARRRPQGVAAGRRSDAAGRYVGCFTSTRHLRARACPHAPHASNGPPLVIGRTRNVAHRSQGYSVCVRCWCSPPPELVLPTIYMEWSSSATCLGGKGTLCALDRERVAVHGMCRARSTSCSGGHVQAKQAPVVVQHNLLRRHCCPSPRPPAVRAHPIRRPPYHPVRRPPYHPTRRPPYDSLAGPVA